MVVGHCDGYRHVLAVRAGTLAHLIALHPNNCHHLPLEALHNLRGDIVFGAGPPDLRVDTSDWSVVDIKVLNSARVIPEVRREGTLRRLCARGVSRRPRRRSESVLTQRAYGRPARNLPPGSWRVCSHRSYSDPSMGSLPRSTAPSWHSPARAATSSRCAGGVCTLRT